MGFFAGGEVVLGVFEGMVEESGQIAIIAANA